MEVLLVLFLDITFPIGDLEMVLKTNFLQPMWCDMRCVILLFPRVEASLKKNYKNW